MKHGALVMCLLGGLALGAVRPAAAEGALLINEFLANPGSLDANQDGIAHTTQDEFIELVNTAGAPLPLGGWSLWDALQARHVFAADSAVPAYGFLVTFGGGSPVGFLNAVTASTGTLSLNNTGDTISLKDADGITVDSMIYTSAQALAGQSLTRLPEAIGPFAGHLQASSLPASPGTTADGRSTYQDLPPPGGPPPAPVSTLPEPSGVVLFGMGIAGAYRLRNKGSKL